MKIDLNQFKDPMVVGGISLMREIVAMGYEAYIVGGTVRDLAMGDDNIHDIDIATNLPINEIKKKWRTIEYGGGEKHGTVIVNYHGHDYELTQFRTEGTYSDSRRPDSVEFVKDFREDTKRRDFTINAMGMDYKGNVIDYHGGIDDIKGKKLRTVGNPQERFNEDVLRMLRAIRFAARFGYDVSDDVIDAMKEMSYRITTTSKERICDEFLKIISYGGDKFANAIKFMQETHMLSVISPELDDSVTENKLNALRISDTRDPIVNFSILIYDVPDKVDSLKDKLKLDNRTLRGVRFITRNYANYGLLDELPRSKAYDIVTDMDFVKLRVLYIALNGSDIDNADVVVDKIKGLKPIYDMGKVISNAIVASRVKPGVEFGRIKDMVMESLYNVYIEHSVIPDGDDIKSIIDAIRGCRKMR